MSFGSAGRRVIARRVAVERAAARGTARPRFSAMVQGAGRSRTLPRLPRGKRCAGLVRGNGGGGVLRSALLLRMLGSFQDIWGKMKELQCLAWTMLGEALAAPGLHAGRDIGGHERHRARFAPRVQIGESVPQWAEEWKIGGVKGRSRQGRRPGATVRGKRKNGRMTGRSGSGGRPRDHHVGQA